MLNDLQANRKRHTRWFNCAQIDGILQSITAKANSPPVLEFTSIGAGGGKTHLLYLLTSLAVLPAQHGGKDGCVVIVDTDDNFSIKRLVQQIRYRLATWSPDIDDLDAVVQSALYHVYIYKPQSMRDLVETLFDLPDYFLHENHYSLDRSMTFIAVDSASAFYWQTMAEEENAAFTASMPSSATSGGSIDRPVTYADLRGAIESASRSLQCPVIFSSRHIGRLPRTVAGELPRSLRHSLPAPLAQLPSLRFVVRRVPVKKLPSGLSAAEMKREAVDRAKVVSLSRFECFVNELGLNPQHVQTLRATEDGFYFVIKDEGVAIETRRSAEIVETM